MKRWIVWRWERDDRPDRWREGARAGGTSAARRKIVIPTLAQMRDPGLIPTKVTERLGSVGLSDTDPINLFRITWHNQPVASGGGFGPVNAIELPPALTGVEARIIALVGKWFPTGAHKVGAAFGCLVPGSSPAASTPPGKRRCGPRPATTAAAAHSIRVSSVATPLPSSPRG